MGGLNRIPERGSTMKSLLLVASAIVAALMSTARADDTVRVADVPFISSGPFLIARERGYFKKLGINVVTRIFDDGALAIPAMIAGEIDVSTMPASAGLFNAVAKGAPLVMFLDHGRDTGERAYTTITVTAALASEGLTSSADFARLKGKRIGIPALGSINHYNIAMGLERAKLDPVNDVTYVSGVGQPDLMKMVGQKTIDAAAISYPFSLFARNNGWGPIVATGSAIEEDQQVATVAVHKTFLARNRDALVRFTMAYLRGIEDFNAAAADPKGSPEVVAILAAHTAIAKPELVIAIAPHWSFLSPDGLPNVASVMKMQDYWAKGPFRLVKETVPEDRLFDLSVTREAKQRLDRERPFG
jgi:NitT/TauT family transport system substrate-binding protein